MNTQTTQDVTPQEKRQATQALWNLVVADRIDWAQNNIVKQAWGLINDYFDDNAKGLERHQFTNLETLAGETRSLEVIKDFIRYQMGRDARKNTWRAIIKGGAFGERVIKDIDGLERTADSIVKQAQRAGVMPNDAEQERALIWWMLARRYISYLEHAFVYRSG
jgi:hypothetical protein